MRTTKKPDDSISLQDRDIALLRGLFECRVMTTAHATTLYFDNKIDAANKRLQRLKAAGLISERPRRAFEPSVLFLTRKGLTLLQEQGVLAKYPSFNLPALDRRTRVSDLTISTISWLYPSSGFQLQQNFAVETTNWTSVATSPLQVGDKWQVPVSPPVGNKFYRLKK